MEIIRKYTKFDLCNIIYPLEITYKGLNGTSRPIYKDRRMGMEIFNTVCPTNILFTNVKKLKSAELEIFPTNITLENKL